MNTIKIKCSNCQELKQKTGFYAKSKGSGVQQPCKLCQSKKRKMEAELNVEFYDPRAKENIPWYLRRR